MSKIKTLILAGTKSEMGLQYGKALKYELHASLDILYDFFIKHKKIAFDKLIKKAQILYDKYPFGYQNFIKGVAEGAGLSLDEAKILNGMETLNSLLRNKDEISACSFIAIPFYKAVSHGTIIGRNYDFPDPFSQIAKYLLVTVLYEADTVPTAFIAMPGQIYCPSCINREGMFVELNNGMPSGGYEVNNQRKSLLINLLEVLQHSKTFDQLDKQLSSLQSDYSLIVNIADQRSIKSYEFSSFKGLRTYSENQNTTHVSTNFYLNSTWMLEPPSDKETWQGVSRRDNLLNFDKNTTFTVNDIMKMLDTKIPDGGATWDLTIYQMVYDSTTNDLYLKRTLEDNEWQHVELNDLFNKNLEVQGNYIDL